MENESVKEHYPEGIKFAGADLGINDFEGKPLFEGDLIKHPDEPEIGVIRFEVPGSQFRIQYDPKTHIPSCQIGMQMGERGRAIKIGSIYSSPDLVKWAITND